MKAFLVVGPESSGNRMTTHALIKAGAFGDPGHAQRLDNLEFTGQPEMIVLRRSVPHGGLWPDLSQIIRRMRAAGYSVSVIVTYRDKDYCVCSQLRGGHLTDAKARLNYFLAYKHIYKHLASAGIFPVVCHYASFVGSQEFRELIFSQLGLPCPEMELYDANSKYPDALSELSRSSMIDAAGNGREN